MFSLVPEQMKAETFLRTIAPGSDQFTFQTFSDTKEKFNQDTVHPSVRHGTLKECWSFLIDQSSASHGIFVVINETNLRERTAADIISIRAHWVDLDAAPLTNLKRLKLRPHIIVPTSPNKFHVYWLVKDAPLDQFKGTQKRLAKLVGGDPNVCDLSRVMRLPGFFNQKQPDKPFLVDVYTCEFPSYSESDFVAAFERAEKTDLSYLDSPHRRLIGATSIAGLPGPLT
jgi:hypothetical protein